jgi:superfamily I DNA/RNA helicase
MSSIKLNHQTNGQTTEPQGSAVDDMAIRYPAIKPRNLCLQALTQRKLSGGNRIDSGTFDPSSNKIKVMPMKVSNGLEFPVLALPGVGQIPAKGEDEQEATRVFYAAATRRLVIAVGEDGGFGSLLQQTNSQIACASQ